MTVVVGRTRLGRRVAHRVDLSRSPVGQRHRAAAERGQTPEPHRRSNNRHRVRVLHRHQHTGRRRPHEVLHHVHRPDRDTPIRPAAGLRAQRSHRPWRAPALREAQPQPVQPRRHMQQIVAGRTIRAGDIGLTVVSHRRPVHRRTRRVRHQPRQGHQPERIGACSGGADRQPSCQKKRSPPSREPWSISTAWPIGTTDHRAVDLRQALAHLGLHPQGATVILDRGQWPRRWSRRRRWFTVRLVLLRPCRWLILVRSLVPVKGRRSLVAGLPDRRPPEVANPHENRKTEHKVQMIHRTIARTRRALLGGRPGGNARRDRTARRLRAQTRSEINVTSG